ncbi:Pol polyprotein [Elysia marginata]|uniref:Pol polyprotein n=1 Tax=Elysia marginata TaxID=1093978 RepID=A0AAV4I690_9GAST|nr:Pol polyprotein [Elysia marginata]
MRFVSRKRRPYGTERRDLTLAIRILLRQWQRLNTSPEGQLWEQLVLPQGLIPMAMRLAHDHAGHQGPERTFELLRRRCY